MLINAFLFIIVLFTTLIDIKFKEVMPKYAYLIVGMGLVLNYQNQTLILNTSLALFVYYVGYLMYSCGWWGGADVKMMTSLAFFYGVSNSFSTFLLAFSLFGLGYCAWIVYFLKVNIKAKIEFPFFIPFCMGVLVQLIMEVI